MRKATEYKIRLMRYLLGRGETVRYALKVLRLGGGTYSKYHHLVWENLTTPWMLESLKPNPQQEPQEKPPEKPKVDVKRLAKLIKTPPNRRKLCGKPARKPKFKLA